MRTSVSYRFLGDRWDMELWFELEVDRERWGEQDVRGAQFRSATPRALTAQHRGVLSRPGQTNERL